MLTVVKFEEVAGTPKIKLDLHGLLRVGDPVKLPRFKVERTTPEGRFEVLEAEPGRFRVTAVSLDASSVPHRQLLSVESAGGAPLLWRAVKKPVAGRKRLSAAVFPRTPIR